MHRPMLQCTTVKPGVKNRAQVSLKQGFAHVVAVSLVNYEAISHDKQMSSLPSSRCQMSSSGVKMEKHNDLFVEKKKLTYLHAFTAKGGLKTLKLKDDRIIQKIYLHSSLKSE